MVEHGPYESSVAKDLALHLKRFRLRLVDRLYVVAAILAALYAPVLAWRISTVPWHAQLGVNAAFVLLGLGLFPFRRRLSLQLKTGIVIGAPLLISVSSTFTMGMAGAGYLWTLEAVVLAAVLHSIRAGIALAVGGSVLLTAAGVGFASGLLVVPLDLNANAINPSAWAGFLVVVVFALLSVLYAFASYQTMVQELTRELDTQRRHLADLVGHDQLTGLPLSALAMYRLEMLLATARRAGQRAALLFIDLDGFKAVNDVYGHSAGDHLLTMIVQRLRSAVREGDTVARVGGDEFIVILSDICEPASATQVADKIMNAVAAPLLWNGLDLSVSASIGIALFPDHAQDADQLRRVADAAMYQAKKQGKSRWRLALVTSIRHQALKNARYGT